MDNEAMTTNTKELLQYSALIALNNSLFRDGIINENTKLNIDGKQGILLKEILNLESV